MLMAFVSFTMEPGFDPSSATQPSFGTWMSHRPELKRWVRLAVSCSPSCSQLVL